LWIEAAVNFQAWWEGELHRGFYLFDCEINARAQRKDMRWMMPEASSAWEYIKDDALLCASKAPIQDLGVNSKLSPALTRFMYVKVYVESRELTDLLATVPIMTPTNC